MGYPLGTQDMNHLYNWNKCDIHKMEQALERVRHRME